MQKTSGGYILVLRDRRSAWAGVRVRVSRFPGEAWLARARRLLRHGRRIPPALRLLASHYADDPARVRAQLSASLGPRFAERGRVREARLARMLTPALAEDRVRLEARFDAETGLFRTPGDGLPGPVKQLVARLRRAIVARTPERRRLHAAHLRRPYALGLLWPLLGERLEAEGIPALYRGEAYRALVRALAGCHLTDAEMAATLEAVNAQPADYRVGAWEFRRFSRRGKAGGIPGLERFAFYLLDPNDHMRRGFDDYRRRVHRSVPVHLANWSFRILQIGVLAATGAGVAWLLLRVENGLMPGLTLFFAAGAAIIAGRLYRRPDMAKLFGRVGERALERARAALEAGSAHFTPPSVAASAVRPASPLPQKPSENTPYPVDIPAPVPVPAPVPLSGAAAEVHRPVAAAQKEPAAANTDKAPSVDEVARAWMMMPLAGPIPFPVPRTDEEAEPHYARPAPPPKTPEPAGNGRGRAETATDDFGGAEGVFVLGWGMPIPVPNWMAASAPDAPPPSSRQAKEGVEEAERAIRNAGMFHAPPLPPVLPSAAFWGIEGTGLPAGTEPRPGGGDSSRRRDS